MKTKKRTLIILASIVVLCLAGLGVSQFTNWSVDGDNASGNIGKASRYSQATSEEGISNLQELLSSDENFKDGVIMSYLLMNTRAKEFSALVDASVDVAGGIPEFSDILGEMEAARETIENVCKNMDDMAKELDTALGGEQAKDLAQNAMNAALAYNTLQEKNELASRFIETADAYLAGHAGTDGLKLVRDQWVDYQRVTAALANDQEAALQLEEKGYSLTSEEAASALGSFPSFFQSAAISNTLLTEAMGFTSSLKAVDINLESLGLLQQGLGESVTLPINPNGKAPSQGLANSEASALANTTEAAMAQNAEATLSAQARLPLFNTEGVSLGHLFRLHSVEGLQNLNLSIGSTLNDIITVDWVPMGFTAIQSLANSDVAGLQSLNFKIQQD